MDFPLRRDGYARRVYLRSQLLGAVIMVSISPLVWWASGSLILGAILVGFATYSSLLAIWTARRFSRTAFVDEQSLTVSGPRGTKRYAWPKVVSIRETNVRGALFPNTYLWFLFGWVNVILRIDLDAPVAEVRTASGLVKRLILEPEDLSGFLSAVRVHADEDPTQ